MKAARFQYDRPARLDDALKVIAAGGSMVVSGSQSLGPMLNLRLAQPEALVDVSLLPELRGYAEDSEGLIIGAGVTHAEIEDGLLPDLTNGILPRVAAGIAYRAVRNRGTIGGSLAHADPAADWVSSLMALDAEVLLRSARGARRMRLTDFVTGAFATARRDDEILVAVRIRQVHRDSRFGYFKTCRKTGELARAIGVVFQAAAEDRTRVVMGATGGRPVVVDASGLPDEAMLSAALETEAPTIDEIDSAVYLEVVRRAARMSEVA
ncbi:carbon-monoxide dehydrogenase medium subunit [Natronocella acetinitrilica]|uniref:Carbon-monoxide dehydrogenase medium subunit n=1 Tax=Natronocella acetinitrilica TaxID=414046 RepID=A0AAE3KAL6_9GAMM|nr:FAD binding domain-containing protein [Natronocella acetinitrilica]MCP1673566.1 carbon-monoxide dehydrogenase medium subunit [Natronocella acetinitrilica]